MKKMKTTSIYTVNTLTNVTNMETFDNTTKTGLKTGLTIIVVKTMTDVDYNEDSDEYEESEYENRVLKANTMKVVMKTKNMKIVKTMTMSDVENDKDSDDGDEQL